MRAKIHKVSFHEKRHTEIRKDLLDAVKTSFSELEQRVAGYAVVMWDDAGCSSYTIRAGGPVAPGGVPIFVFQKLSNCVPSYQQQPQDAS